ncbi:unnamed protein product [Nippostrongylus brasiliensis]|uniref:Phosphoglycerate mutase family protein n=1 Tax=Nippostrongylus brasiliensis TaxID=27835 RepID=A0A0N4XZ52_NIPBR|nr:unnamed protein product [Nippostrongylus brasiliensis]
MISVEPGLHEWMQWTKGVRPNFMELIELQENGILSDNHWVTGYPINPEYKPLIDKAELPVSEKLDDIYERAYSVVKHLLERHSSGTILLVAHGDMLDSCTRKLCGGEPRIFEDFFALVHRTPFVGCVQAVEQEDGRWKIGSSPIPTLTHIGNASYDCQQLSRPVAPWDDQMKKKRPPWM